MNLPPDFLRSEGLSNFRFQSYDHAIRIPYFHPDSTEAALRFRIAIYGIEDTERKHRWQKNSKPMLYGLQHCHQYHNANEITLVEGETDTLCLRFEGFPAFGLPGNALWKEERDAGHFDGFQKIYVVVEPGTSGEGLLKWLAKSSIRTRCFLVRMSAECKDPAALYRANPAGFADAWEALLAKAQPWAEYERSLSLEARTAAREKAKRLLVHPNILEAAVTQAHKLGVVGEERLVKLTYLCMTSRILDKIVSMVVKGPSSSGKSYIVKQTASLFPSSSFIERTAMSARALYFTEEDLRHRTLIFYEATALADSQSGQDHNNPLAYAVRSLLSEGRLVYEISEKTGTTRVIDKPGPTGLIMTTTDNYVESETETRVLSITTDDTIEQTGNIILAQAEAAMRAKKSVDDLSEWHALQEFLQLETNTVTIPFATALAALINDAGHSLEIRMRRDFPSLLALIEAHALLHRESRKQTEDGVIDADLLDYDRVRSLVNELMSDAAGVGVPESVRKVRHAVASLIEEINTRSRNRKDGTVPPTPSATIDDLTKVLDQSKSVARRWANDAVGRGYLALLDDGVKRRGRNKHRFILGDAIKADGKLLPTARQVHRKWLALAKASS